ncbi:histone-lysine N-methyltransferase SUVR4-like isoform X1 [Prosopis cineraria]|uniref:histone-lysine N-methyltransferase SUVR4-like isoform X1 n=1 Tax=Prosopis cineraria TaxID=364024 RepID=UPI002410AA23|nr:histone-lysine N-methyltransferase SUVR4-like isoform X1 [Prosopis cineraria]XP_054803700.1 histone-lysine N-methyltransferase SUVR4-like isoform X1 [Prosopis cineraria]XP_054803701.1 histone-lysine N-methyltransferase SUVR4-like isoform X1 [Prosopis cineraria]XP_054803702.1 histone-lysine N-methyltransferase SUVR4-like isoform X1 [Prosopis cineraria]
MASHATPNSRVIKAFNAMKDLGISSDEVKPVLQKLLRLYDKNWEYIEEDNYRTLIDAYFELKEDKEAEGKRKALTSDHGGEKQMQPLANKDDVLLLTTDNSRQKLSTKDNEMPLNTFGQEIVETSQPSMSNTRPKIIPQLLRTRINEVERISKFPSMSVTNRRSNSEKTSSTRHGEGLVDEPSFTLIRRENLPNEHNRGEIMKQKTKHNKLHLESSSTSYKGSYEVLTRNHPVKLVSSLYMDLNSAIDDSAHNNNPASSKTNIEIASSTLGEVKISLNCDHALEQPNFYIPNLSTVMKFMEEKYLQPTNIVGPQISMVNLLNSLCENFLKLGMHVNQKHSHPEFNNANILTNGPQQAIAQDEKKLFHFLSDITKGSEKVKISLIDEYGNGEFPNFNYTPNNIIYQSANVNISLARIADEGCCSSCLGNCLSQSLPCACAQETGGEFAYTLQGLLKDEFLISCISMKKEPQAHQLVYCQECPLERSKNEYMPEQCKGHLIRKFIKECWKKCGCDMQCGNRIVQRGLRCKLQVFFTSEKKGWGLRTLEDLPKGSFICEYAGEILTNMELYERIVHKNGNDRHTYPVTLDADWGSEGALKDEEALCLDATYNGNVARFINHRCSDATLIDIPVEVETPDRHYYHLAFFTNRKVNAYEELTWDYGIDFDDHDHPIKAFQCCCGSPFCRDKKRKGKRKLAKCL